MAKIPIKINKPNTAGDLILDTDLNRLEVYSDGIYKDPISELSLATETQPGLMDSTDKINLNNVNNYINKIIQVPINLWSFTGHTGYVNALVFGSDGYLYSGSFDNSVRKINPATGTEVWSFTGHTNTVYALAYGSDGYLYSGSYDNTVRKINPATGEQVWSFTGHTGIVRALAFGGDGYLYSGSVDKTVRKIDPSNGTQMWSFTGHTATVGALAFGGGYLYSASYDKTIRKINPTNGTQIWSFTWQNDYTQTLASGPDPYVYSGSYRGAITKIIEILELQS